MAGKFFPRDFFYNKGEVNAAATMVGSQATSREFLQAIDPEAASTFNAKHHFEFTNSTLQTPQQPVLLPQQTHLSR